jgi:hypothetical protein
MFGAFASCAVRERQRPQSRFRFRNIARVPGVRRGLPAWTAGGAFPREVLRVLTKVLRRKKTRAMPRISILGSCSSTVRSSPELCQWQCRGECQDSRRPEEKEEEQAQALRRAVVGHRPVVILEHMGFIPECQWEVLQKYEYAKINDGPGAGFRGRPGKRSTSRSRYGSTDSDSFKDANLELNVDRHSWSKRSFNSVWREMCAVTRCSSF